MKVIQSKMQDKIFVSTLLKRYAVPGISYCFILKGQALKAEAIGVKNTETRELMRADTMFEAASLTKTLFATLVMRLVDQGIFSLDEPVASLLPSFKLSDDDRINTLTVRQILSHGTGLPNWADKPLPFLFDPGKGFRYSGEGYYYLHRIVNEVTGKDFVDHYRDEFFEPLKMNHSRAIWDPSILDYMANKFDVNGKMFPLRDFIDLGGNAPEPNAAWSLYSGAEDYAKFLLEILNNKGHLSESAFKEMVSPQNDAGNGILWGLGWGLSSKDPSVIWHWGDNGGYRSFATVDYATGDGVCIFCNGAGGTDLCLAFLDQTTDGEFWGNVSKFLETAEE
ncbi:MAG: class A beta-lactamase-related serine hydrolase [Clostridia bacterium]|nr:class A beta-lactamase-related serine hydrolase [Clostridia bacterium]